jgi:hypothetical protein
MKNHNSKNHGHQEAEMHVAENTQEATVTEQATAEVSPTAGTKDGAKVLLADGTPRIDYIKKRWADGASRSQITKEINEKRVAGSNVIPYQIVFAATKGLPQPPKAEQAAEPAAEPAAA